MLDLFNLPTPQNCNIQTFYGTGATIATSQQTWIKPRGVSYVYMLVIGSGGNGDGTTGGGSGAVTVWYGSAQNVPDSLIVTVSAAPSNNSSIRGRFNSGLLSGIILINSAGGTTGGAGGTAMTANQFCASGFFQSIAGQLGSPGDPGASTTTFLSGGGSGTTGVTANYGYSLPATSSRGGIFMLQPIIVGMGATGNLNGGIGCGGGHGVLSQGGPGFVLIASW